MRADIYGGADVDTLEFDFETEAGGKLVVDGNDGMDTIEINSSTPDARILLFGGAGEDTLTVKMGRSDVFGGDEGDTIEIGGAAGSGRSYAFGGAGDDVIRLAA